MLNVFTKFYKTKKHEIMLNTFSLSLIIWKTAIETWAQEMNGGPGTNWGGKLNSSAHLGNYTLIPVKRPVNSCMGASTSQRRSWHWSLESAADSTVLVRSLLHRDCFAPTRYTHRPKSLLIRQQHDDTDHTEGFTSTFQFLCVWNNSRRPRQHRYSHRG